MMRKLTILMMSLALCFTTLACGSPPPKESQNRNFNTTANVTSLSQGEYGVQQATYDDSNGEYSLVLLNTPPGTPSVYRTTDLPMARLTDEEIQSGKKSYLKVENNQKSFHLTEDFKIEYVHNVTQNQTNPQTGQPETVIVRRESNFWTPFAGALAGQVVGNLLFRPQYYVPPVYQPGGVLRGFGGYGTTYSQAVDRYQTRYQAPPPAVRNRQTLRTTGRLRTPSYSNRSQPSVVRRNYPSSTSRSTGSGYSGSNLRRSNGSSSPSLSKRTGSFGTSSRRSPARSGRRR